MDEPTAEATLSSEVESNLYNDVQELFKAISSPSASSKEMLTWTLQKKVEADPSCSVLLINVLIRELEKKVKRVSQIHKTRSYMPIIPVLHTLYYVVIQSGVMIPNSLYQRVYECLMKLLILPLPYSAVALRTLRSIKMEMTTPGSLYQSRVMAEQNLKSEHFTLQEKVFVLADPAVFSAPLEATVRAYLEVSGLLSNTNTVEKRVVLRVLQTGLEMTCQSSRLAQTLEALEDHAVKKYFQELVQAIKQSIKRGAGGREDYLNTLQHIYTDIMAASEKDIIEVNHGSVHNTAMPLPKINFLMWKDEEDLWNLLAKFTLCSCPNVGEDEEEIDKRDSGIERDLQESNINDTTHHSVSALKRRNAYKSIKSVEKLSLVKEKIEAAPGRSPVVKEERSLTARVVVLGDDRVLGRLTKAYHSIREKESKHNILTKKLNLQLYYIPITGVEPSFSSADRSCQDEGRLSLASYLERVDPWYNRNVNNLSVAISQLPKTHSNHSETSELNLFLLDTLCYYLRCGTQPVNLPLYSVKMTRCDVNPVVEEMFVSHLEANIPEFRYLKQRLSKKPPTRQRKSSTNHFGAFMSVSYTKTSSSKRDVLEGDSHRTCGVVITSEPAASTSGEDFLAVILHSVSPENNTKIRTKRITIRMLERWTLCVCLDRDSRRTYTGVQRIEIAPCLDPGCNIQPKFSVSNDRELPLSKYLDKVLSLPINTFTGVTI